MAIIFVVHWTEKHSGAILILKCEDSRDTKDKMDTEQIWAIYKYIQKKVQICNKKLALKGDIFL